MPKVLISDKLSIQAKNIFKKYGIDVSINIGLSHKELLKVINKIPPDTLSEGITINY